METRLVNGSVVEAPAETPLPDLDGGVSETFLQQRQTEASHITSLEITVTQLEAGNLVYVISADQAGALGKVLGCSYRVVCEAPGGVPLTDVIVFSHMLKLPLFPNGGGSVYRSVGFESRESLARELSPCCGIYAHVL